MVETCLNWHKPFLACKLFTIFVLAENPTLKMFELIFLTSLNFIRFAHTSKTCVSYEKCNNKLGENTPTILICILFIE